jgi:putative DNA primase/helicase
VATREDKEGGKDGIIQIPALWVDVDFKNTKKREVYKLIGHFQLKPSMIVMSGRGLHLYWILETPAEKQDIPKIENINKWLASHFHGDKAIDASRVLRLPGTYNQKYDPKPLVTLSSVNDNTYHLGDFDPLPSLPPTISQAVSMGKPPSTYTKLLEGVREGERHTSLLLLVGHYKGKGLPEDETQSLLALWNQKNLPPLEEKELRDTIKYSYTHYGKDETLSTMPDYTDYCTIIENSAMKVTDFIVKSLLKRLSIIDPWLKQGEIGLISAPRGVGKTWLSLLIAMAATRKMAIGKWTTENAIGCLYIDGEMAEDEMQSRLFDLQQVCPRGEATLKLLSSDALRSQNVPAPNFVNMDCRKGILDYLKKHEDIRLLIIDNLACLTPGLDENNKRDWDQINQCLLQLRSIGAAVIMIHHTGKSGEQRGTSAREDILNFSMKLKRPEGYSPEDGAKFIVEFTKGRRLYGDKIRPFTLCLQKTTMNLEWTVDENEVKKDESIISLLKDGLKQRDIAEELNISPSYVAQVKKKAKKAGKLDITEDLGKENSESKIEEEEIKDPEGGLEIN